MDGSGLKPGRTGLWIIVMAAALASRPQHAAPQDLLRLRNGEFGGDMAERAVEDAALPMPALPDDGHHNAGRPRRIFAGKRGGRQNLVRRIDMHVILLGPVRKSGDALHDRIVGPRDVDAIVDDVAGMGDPLTAAHEVVLDALAERVAHAAVIAGETDAALHR